MTLRNRTYNLILIVLLLALAGCGSGGLSTHEYIQFVQNPSNGLHVTKTLGQYIFEAQYEPKEYLVVQENKLSPAFTASMLKEKVKEFEGMHYFVFRIKNPAGSGNFYKDISSSVQAYMSFSEYFSVKMQNDLSLYEGEKQCPCTLFHCEPQNGISGQLIMVVGFESNKDNHKSDLTFVYDDKILGVGTVKLTIRQSDIESLSKLKTV